MNKNIKNMIAGYGKKRPQINIPLEYLHLDIENPRIASKAKKITESDTFQILYNDYDLEDIAYSMSENGYFDEEPIVVIPKNIPNGFNVHDDIGNIQIKIDKLITEKKIDFIVLEGNRRIATAKILTDDQTRNKLNVSKDFPKPKNKSVENDLQIIPSIVYFKRDDVTPYLGVRHITGVLKWEAYEKALYISKIIEKSKNTDRAIKDIQLKIGDNSNSIKKQYMCFKIVEQAELEGFKIKEIKRRFSLLMLATTSGSIREFIGLKPYKEVTFNKPLVSKNKLYNLILLLTWIYGNSEDKEPVLTDSRKITSRLAPVLASKQATEYLIKYEDLEQAYERSEGEKDYLLKKISEATKNINIALSIAYKFRSTDVYNSVIECEKAIVELKKMVNK